MMKLLLLAVCAAAVYSAPQSDWIKLKAADKYEDPVLRFHPSEVPFEKQWKDFKIQHNKVYEGTDEHKRREIFRTNLKTIAMHNYLFDKGVKSYRLGVNEYADMTSEEFVKVMNGYRSASTPSSTGRTYLSPLAPMLVPSKVDWRDKGYVTPVKNQGQCGSCWAFSTTGSLEGQHFRQSGKLVSLSEQNLVDCSAHWGNHGCNGGLMDNGFQYIEDNHGIDTEKSYPYTARQGTCHFKKAKVGATDTGFTDIPEGDEDKLKEALASVGPVSVAIDASHKSFQLYESGVYDEPECSSTALDHGVLAVGYGSLDGQDYWLVKNSWGATWGKDGYIYMSRNKDNQCGIASKASYPDV